MNECEKYQEMISAMLDGELGPAESERLIAHMSSCAGCRELYELLSAVSGDSAWELPEPPEGLHEHIMSGVKAHAVRQRSGARVQRLRPLAATAACLVLIAGVVFGVPRFFRAGSSAPAAFNTTATANSNAAPAAPADAPADDAAGSDTVSGAPALSDGSGSVKNAVDNNAADTNDGRGDEPETAPLPEPESVPEPAEDVEPPELDIDIAKSTLTVESGGRSTSEKLSRDDTLIWLSAVIEGRAGSGIDAAKIEIFRLEGADYSVYIYHDGSRLMGSLSEELTDGVELKKLEDFTVFAQMFDEDK